jgi:heat shock protein HslJ/uncharacterized lipoprotein NlpE involved in copper resistance
MIMKRHFLFLAIAIALVFGTTSCKTNTDSNKAIPTGHNSQNSLDWAGTYTGMIPCADCPGIIIKLTLNSDMTYSMTRTYQDREAVVSTAGTFEWNDAGSIISLDVDEKEGFRYFQVQENRLLMLDTNGKVITGKFAESYILSQKPAAVFVPNQGIIGNWRLVELMGEPVSFPEGAKEAFISFREDGSVNGSFGCNSFFGTYTLEDGDRIQFSQMGSTMMMCIDMTIEDKFKEVLGMVDNYNLSVDQLVLNRARMAPLARFEAIGMEE